MQGLIPLVLATILFGFWGLANKYAVQDAHPYTVQWIYAVPYIVTAPIWYWMAKRASPDIGSNPRTLLWTMLASLSAILAVGFMFFALRHRSATFTTAVTAMYPAITLLLAIMMGDETFNLTRIGGIVMIIGGVFIVQWSGT